MSYLTRRHCKTCALASTTCDATAAARSGVTVSKLQGHVPAVALLTERHSWQSAVVFDKTNVTACARHGVCKRNATACVWQWHQDVIDATAKRPQ